jgi:hypothetical protein
MALEISYSSQRDLKGADIEKVIMIPVIFISK